LEELVLEWKKENPVTTADLGMSQFELDEITVAKCPSTESFGQIGETFSNLLFLLSPPSLVPTAEA
jgi:hypothetical protein